MLFSNWKQRADLRLWAAAGSREQVPGWLSFDWNQTEIMNEGMATTDWAKKKQYEHSPTETAKCHRHWTVPLWTDSYLTRTRSGLGLDILLTKGLKVNYGSSVGKTIIFAKNHLHAEKDSGCLESGIPWISGAYCRVIDNYYQLCAKPVGMNFPIGTSCCKSLFPSICWILALM